MIEKLNYFSDDEQSKQKRFASSRTKLLRPLLHFLTKVGLTPDGISYFALSLLIPFLYFFNSNPIISSICLATYVLLDGLDGALARFQKKDNLGGAFTDIVVDQLGLVVIIGSLIYYGQIDATIGYYYGILYIIMIAFSVVQNALEIPMQRLIRTKYIIFLVYILTSIQGIKSFTESIIPLDLLYDSLLILFSIIMLITSTISYIRLKNFLSNR